MAWVRVGAAVICLGVGAAGCSNSSTGAGSKGCDPLDPSYCGFPYPNDYYTVDDPSTPTGKRLAIPEAIIPTTQSGSQYDVTPFNQADGFSPGLAGLVDMPGATTTGLPTPDTIADSVLTTSPTIVLDADTGQLVPHWAELDWYAIKAKELENSMFMITRPDSELAQEQALMIRPAVRLDDATRYIIAIRNVKDANGNVLPPSPAFQALRDGTPSGDPSVEARRAHFADIFQKLSDAGISTSDLQIAWDFTTASRENNTARVVHMRDDALASFPNGVPYTVQASTDGIDTGNIACRLDFTFDMPLYLDKGSTGGVLNYGPNGLPEQNGTYQYTATMIVPLSAQTTPAPLVAWGHGLLGSGSDVVSSSYERLANSANLAFFGLDWIGMANDDVVTLLGLLNSGNLAKFGTVPDRLDQSFVNFILAMRTLSTEAQGPSTDALNQALASSCGGAQLDGTQRYYLGGSQGGIFGASLMSLFTDVTRGVLAVPGQPYDLLLNRSTDFSLYASPVYAAYDWNALDMQLNLALIQGLWDRAAPTGFSKYIRTDMLPNTPSHDVMMQVSIGDHQVSNLGAYIMARTIGGMFNVNPVYSDVYGVPSMNGGPTVTGSGMLQAFFGNTATPTIDIPPWQDPVGDPHGCGLDIATMPQMASTFLRSGVIQNLCNGVCDYTDDLIPQSTCHP